MDNIKEKNTIEIEELTNFLKNKSSKWAKISKKKKQSSEQKAYAQGCFLAYMSVEDWINSKKD